MKRKLLVIGSALGIILVSFVMAGFLASQKKVTEIKKIPIPKRTVRTKKIDYTNLDTEIVTYGRVETAESLDLFAEVSGRMSQGNMKLKAGQNFKKGALLFYIDDREMALDLKSQKSNFIRDLANIIPDMKLDFPTNFDTWQTYFNSLDTDKKFRNLPKVKSEQEKIFLATKNIFSLFYSIQSAEVRLDKYRYYAPFAGSIMEVRLQSGSYVNVGANIGKIIRKGVHELKVTVEVKNIPWIEKNTQVKVFSEETQQYWTGSVIRISDFVNQNTQSVDIFIAIHSNNQRIYDGQFLQATIPSQTITNGMIIPRNAIYNRREVFVVEDSLLKVKEVNIIRFSEENAIFNGLEEGEDLVIEPLIGAYNNMIVKKNEQLDVNLELGKEKKSSLKSGL